MQPRPSSSKRIYLSWEEVDHLIDILLPKFNQDFNAMVMITRGGIIPGGLLAEAMGITHILTAAVDFPFEQANEPQKLMSWPKFIQFPSNEQLNGRAVLIVDDVWGSGRTITAVKNRVIAAGAFAETCVLHFNPYRSLFDKSRPDYFADVTDAHIIYPWEISRGTDRIMLGAGDRL